MVRLITGPVEAAAIGSAIAGFWLLFMPHMKQQQRLTGHSVSCDGSIAKSAAGKVRLAMPGANHQ
jgi:hypothetical protein